MQRLTARPFVGLGALALVLGLFLAALGRFVPRFEPDSGTYIDGSVSLAAPAASHRTWGYPLFLRCLGSVERAPLAHFVAHGLACGIFLSGLLRIGYRSWTALWCSGTLIFGRAMFDLGSLILADGLAISLAIASAGCLMAVLSSRAGVVAWLGLIVFTFLTYQVRPAYLFLIPLWPVIALFLNLGLLRRRDRWPSQVRRAGLVALATLVPFLAYCTLRWCFVGQWGLVSFAGYNFIGIAGQFLDRELAQELPAELRPLAEEIVKRRSERPEILPPDDFATMCKMFNPTVWGLAVPAATELGSGETAGINRQLVRLSQAILWQRPGRYAKWLLENSIHGVRHWIGLTAFDKGTYLLAMIYLATHLSVYVRGNRVTPPPVDRQDDGGIRRLELHLLVWTALLFAIAKTALVVLVEPAIDRYMSGAMIFFPAAISVWVAQAVSLAFPECAERFNGTASAQP